MNRKTMTATAHTGRISPLLTEGLAGPLEPARLVMLSEALAGAGAECGLLIVRGDRPPRSVAVSGEWAACVEAIQVEERTGPSLETTASPVRVPDLSHETRWAAFAQRATREYDAHGVLSVPLPVGGADRAALTFYCREPNCFDDLDDDVLAMLAHVAGLSVEAALRQEDVTDLEAALDSSRRIGTALGVLMAADKVTTEEAFARLTDTSQRLNRKLRDIAAEVAESGQLPGPGQDDRRP